MSAPTNDVPAPYLPGFDASLRLLVQRERYSQTDIALMFGVSRERVRQWCDKRGIEYPPDTPRGLHAVRIWNDAANQFEPQYASEIVRRKRDARRAQRRQALVARRGEFIRRAKSVIDDLTLELDRTPTWLEIARTLGYKHDKQGASSWILLCAFGSKARNRGTQRFCEAIGFTPRDRGFHGHLRDAIPECAA